MSEVIPDYSIKELRPEVRNYLIVIISISFLLLIILPFLYPLKLDRNFLIFFIFLILVECLPIQLPRGTITFGYSILIAGIILFNPATLVYLVYLPGLIMDLAIRRHKLLRALYNAGQLILSVLIGNRVYQIINNLLNYSSNFPNPLIIFFTAAIYMSINSHLVFTVFSLSENISVFSLWKENVRWLLSAYFLFAFLGIILIYIYTSFPYYFLGIFIIFLISIRYFFKQSMKLLITQQKIAKLEKEKEKLELLGEMASKLSHEIKNPLHAIRGFSELLKSKYKSDQEEFLYSHWIITNIERIDRIIKDSLQFTKNARPNLAPCNVNTVLEKAIQYSSIPEYLELVKSFEPKLPEGMFDARLLESAFINLLTNAVQAIKDKGKIIVSTNFDEFDILIGIEDTGCGIPEENLEKIFQPFFTTKQEGASSGLGLSIVKNIVDKHGGKILVSSCLNKGTKFEIRLPLKSSNR